MLVLREKYIPSKWRAWRIGKDLTNMTRELGYEPLKDDNIQTNPGAAWYRSELHAEVRITAVPHSQGTGWHQDGDMDSNSNMDHGLIVWANRTPTEFKIGEEIFQPLKFQLVYFKNLDGYHRRPADAPARRFMFRQRVEL